VNTPGFLEVALSVVLVAIAIALSLWKRLQVAGDMALGTVRAFVQLVAVGYALHLIFSLESWYLIVLAMLIMLAVGSYTAAGRVKNLTGAFGIVVTAMFIGSAITLLTMLAAGIVVWEAQMIIPLAGMIIGNSMNACTLTIDRLCSDISGNRLAVETSLSLGKSWRFATHRYQRDAARAGMLSILNFLKTVGIVALPGAMTGMILGGAEPLDAVLLQLIVGYMLLASNTITSVVAAELAVRRFFTPQHQLGRIC